MLGRWMAYIELRATLGEPCQNNSRSLPDDLPFITIQCWICTCRRAAVCRLIWRVYCLYTHLYGWILSSCRCSDLLPDLSCVSIMEEHRWTICWMCKSLPAGRKQKPEAASCFCRFSQSADCDTESCLLSVHSKTLPTPCCNISFHSTVCTHLWRKYGSFRTL